MKLKCISARLNYVGFSENGTPYRVRVGDTFEANVKKIPEKWVGLVTEVEPVGKKVAVTNPAK